MLTLASRVTEEVKAIGVRFEDHRLIIALSDNREISLRMDKIEWLSWLAKATPEQRERWSVEPGGYAIYWEELDDGIELCHVLAMYPLA